MTMSSTDTIIRTEIDKAMAQVQRALERGGLPTEAEAAAIYEALSVAAEKLEGLTWRIEGITTGDAWEHIPEVTLEQVGVVALLIDDVANETERLTSMNERIRSRISALSAFRAEQQSRRGDDV